MSDPLLRMLANLPSAEPDPTRARRVRTRAHAALARRAARSTSSTPAALGVWKPVVAAFSVVYLTEAMHQALRLYGIL